METVYENHFTGEKKAGKDGIENFSCSSKKYPYSHEKGLSYPTPTPPRLQTDTSVMVPGAVINYGDCLREPFHR